MIKQILSGTSSALCKLYTAFTRKRTVDRNRVERAKLRASHIREGKLEQSQIDNGTRFGWDDCRYWN